ncbi:hypothetical protein KR49_03035 [Synechococcus sp. KORDI-49]|jgi:hypothetical protein|uniref:hypothetical protein n=1 Tax=Synechococcales TaxID=1890424 RepID=UPI0004E0A8EF|nr:hypothetical protein [Synechococcus sp. KORDI-49]AII45438.1 hypothetical protein KR49_03035 [Synechococcus sp. KORDI-49]OUW66228.1 MAG: hypothetical protein CBD65_06090 [Synechococcus sp. TMED205]RCL54794.1 MAG: hypothetical protein DBW84_03395 [Synechococcus sp. MED-G70]HCX53017.1 hypothetical protein [Synechococcus sp. UBA9887]|tara:strand:- start:1272 stop:1706 length:435 start_codon:yes stop_codon:yes gene_type:complete
MSFDPRSLERLRELGRQLPQKLPDPAGNADATTTPKTGPKRHRVETEQDPDALFRELMTVSEDGTVPEHLMARLKQLEARRQPPQTNPLESPIRSSELPPPPSGSSGKGKTTRPRRPSVTPGSEEESLYVAFGQLLLEDDEDAD